MARSNDDRVWNSEFDCYFDKGYQITNIDREILAYKQLHQTKAENASKLGALLRDSSNVLAELGFKLVRS